MSNVIGRALDRVGEDIRRGLRKERTQRTKFAPFDGDGQYFTSVNISASSSATFGHRLGRKVRGWIILRVTCDGTMDGHIHETAVDTETITLQNDATSDVSFDFWIY